MSFQRTAFSSIVNDVMARLQSKAVGLSWVSLLEEPQFWLGDYQVVVRPGGVQPDDGSATGTGVAGSLLTREIEVVVQSRYQVDEGDRTLAQLLAHLDTEETLLAALHLYLPANSSGITTEPIRLVSGSKPTWQAGVMKSTFTFAVTYAAQL